MEKKNFEWLENYIAKKDLKIGSHCTDFALYEDIKKYGISHSGDISTTILFNYATTLDGLKTVKHKGSNCVVIVGIPKEFATKLYFYEKSNGQSFYESEEFSEFAPKEAHLSDIFVLNPKYIVGVYNQGKDEFVLNDDFIGEKENYEQLVKSMIKNMGSKEEKILYGLYEYFSQ